MKRIFNYLMKTKKEFFLAPVLKMLEACFELFVPMVVASIIDRGIGENNFGYAAALTGVMAALAAIGFAFSVTAQFFAAGAAAGLASGLRRDMYSHIQSLSATDMGEKGEAAFIIRLTTDINQAETAVNSLLRLLLRSPVVVIGAMIMAFVIDTRAALIFVGIIPVLAIIVFFITKTSAPKYKDAQDRVDETALILRQNMSGVRVIRAFNRQKKEEEQFDKANNALMRFQRAAGRISAFMNPLTFAVINTGIIILIWVGALRINAGGMSQGQVVALYNYMSQILVELLKAANLIVMMSKARASFDRIDSVFETRAGIKGGRYTAQSGKKGGRSITFTNVSYKYSDAGGDAVRDISFTAKAGETIGIIGGTGSGKSTLVNMIPRLADATKGSIEIDDKNIFEYTLESLRGLIGMVPQRAILFSGSVRENIKAGRPDANDDDIWSALDAAQAGGWIRGTQNGLDEKIERSGVNLSGGQRQRLSIARALVRKPEILILDDSASALDMATDEALRRSIREVSGNMTVFIVSQRVASVMGADKIIVMDNGMITGFGTHDELKSSNPIYKEICKTQLKNT